MAIQKHSIPDSSAAIYAETANINYFLKTALDPDASDGAVSKQKSIPQRSVRRYPGDSSPFTVPTTTATYLYDPGRRNGAATPGKEMILNDGVEKRCFTYTGSWTEVHAYLVGNAKMDLAAYSESARYDIAAVGEGQAQVVKAR